ncbi:MAG: hypothetical protein FWD82_04245 [Defluviitaleaceae bacterium]|nr:hypothetical protein [Defluviitaleaceae bacterium]
MQKTLKDMAKHLNNIILPEPLEIYITKPIFEDIANSEKIHEGVLAFRAFLHRFCDVLIAEGDLYDDSKKKTDEHLSAIAYKLPFFDNVKRLLFNIGVYGELKEDATALVMRNNIFNHKLSVVKNIECLRFLTTCGLRFDGIDLNEKRQKLSEIETVIISYPDNPEMIMGLKVMAIAEKEIGTNLNHNILMRCDYRVIKNDETPVIFVLNHIMKPLSASIQDFVLKLHQLHIDNGLNCTVDVRGFWIKIKYSRGKKEIWGINTSLNRGFEITVKADNVHKYAEAILKFPLVLQGIIARGHGCGKKRGISETCDAGCEGLRIPLDASILDISDGIVTWFEQELLCFRKK